MRWGSGRPIGTAAEDIQSDMIIQPGQQSAVPNAPRPCCRLRENLQRMPTGQREFLLYICRVCDAQHTKVFLEAMKMGGNFK